MGIITEIPLSTILKYSCGYDFENPNNFTKQSSIVYMHLVSPRLNYEGYGKTHIDFTPFNNIGNLIFNVCKGIKKRVRTNKFTQRGVLISYLLRRQSEVRQNKNIILTDRWTPSDIWYANRPVLLENDVDITKNTRSNFTALIRTVCEEHLHINMEEIGIFVLQIEHRLYFDGHWYDVGFDELDSLSLKGADL